MAGDLILNSWEGLGFKKTVEEKKKKYVSQFKVKVSIKARVNV